MFKDALVIVNCDSNEFEILKSCASNFENLKVRIEECGFTLKFRDESNCIVLVYGKEQRHNTNATFSFRRQVLVGFRSFPTQREFRKKALQVLLNSTEHCATKVLQDLPLSTNSETLYSDDSLSIIKFMKEESKISKSIDKLPQVLSNEVSRAQEKGEDEWTLYDYIIEDKNQEECLWES